MVDDILDVTGSEETLG
ncbi:MAG TPA: hypothetical protein VMG62_04490, partial [Solirubrobacteraceae bacterium]|nr:hypothetical protein [Solirubrobacteraceae bacterium]